ncbi:hypothetical protein Pmar_PMAR018751 [Perkinsus marinus ATCC 50983]|uniref:Uncharacterized protein n=1 Tax=Perkinsus marinus (strain ATCC 50983 / TXsc) TaxID=423536 RepID=C5KJ97_PERM5|nr:hypothetical protein Pmar_PMAR018751 [Perkinsus marinus ATCC 50983]EER15399.1 hypothetical protein Pmar_PMAR018751 [Perkinsus marinus ATCC 50983]|eukprot:XP_002783603.1 hypothetical protein Pmar_PMAR018751 [Perkinsus marinus ATCC 50983]
MDNNGINDEDEYRPGGCYHRLSIQLHSIDSLLLLLQVLKTVSGNNKDTTQDASTILHIRASNDDDEAASSSAGGAGAGLYIATESLSKTVIAGGFFPAQLCREFDLKAFTFNHRLGRLQELPIQEFPAQFAIYASPLINALQMFRTPTLLRLLYDSTPIDLHDDNVEDDDDATLKLVIKDESLGSVAECQCIIHTLAINEDERIDASEVLEVLNDDDDLPSAKCDVLATEVLFAIGQELTLSPYLGIKSDIAQGAASSSSSVEANVSITSPSDTNIPALEIKATDWAAADAAVVEVRLPYRPGVVDNIAIANPTRRDSVSTTLPLPGLLCLLRSPCMKKHLRTTLWIHATSHALSARWSIPDETSGRTSSLVAVKVSAVADHHHRHTHDDSNNEHHPTRLNNRSRYH